MLSWAQLYEAHEPWIRNAGQSKQQTDHRSVANQYMTFAEDPLHNFHLVATSGEVTLPWKLVEGESLAATESLGAEVLIDRNMIGPQGFLKPEDRPQPVGIHVAQQWAGRA